MTSPARTLLAAAVIAAAAFLLYDGTLLPGQDLGDTASFEATIGQTILTPREGYPLYYATGNLCTGIDPKDPARTINLASAVFGALASGLLTAAVIFMTRRTVAGVVAGLLLAVSYTFWSQAVIAEVYALHAFMMGLCFLALFLWAARPTLPRLALFFAVYAIGFGNHLQMILLLPGFALFLLLMAPGGPVSMIRPKVALLAVVAAALGASQYLWNFQTLLAGPDHDASLLEQLRTFWFDVTKADWRAFMVMGIPERTLADRFRMYWFDLHQQFGTFGVALALVGVVWMLWPGTLPPSVSRLRSSVPPSASRLPPLSRPRAGTALLLLYLVNWFFAFTYNVGDTHVFYLPSHFMVALFAGLGTAAILSLAAGVRFAASTPHARMSRPAFASRLWRNSSAFHLAVIVILLAYPAWRGYDTYPAMDRSHDWQVKQFFDRLTAGLDGNNSVFATDLNWQLHNGLDYYARYTRPELAVVDTTESLLYFPLLVQSNRAIDRPVAMTDGARSMLTAAYGPLLPIERDVRVPAAAFADRVGGFAPGTPYVLALLDPYAGIPVDPADLDRTLARLTGDTLRLENAPAQGSGIRDPGDPASPRSPIPDPVSVVTVRFPGGTRYNVIAGRVGERPTVARFEDRPFRMNGQAGPVGFDVRIECWLPADTIRRMGFGRVIVGRTPALTLDRGASFVAFDDAGTVKGVEYGWALLAPQARWIIPVRP